MFGLSLVLLLYASTASLALSLPEPREQLPQHWHLHSFNMAPQALDEKTVSIPSLDLTEESASKNLYLIRHGTSLANEHMQQPGNQWGDATFEDDMRLRDAPLSSRGEKECKALKDHLVAQPWLDHVELIVVSPLTRCLQTLEIGVVPAFRDDLRVDTSNRPPIIVLPWIAERVYTASDIGTLANSLRSKWPTFDWSFVPGSAWWYHEDAGTFNKPEWRPHGQGQWYAVAGEPKKTFNNRMAQADAWLRKRPEKNILLVTHWAVIRHFTDQEVSNCDVVKLMNWQPQADATS
jgi:broad specificity phosphatase PhoE